MAEDVKTVQGEIATPQPPKEAEPPQPQPLTEDKIAQMIAQKVEEAKREIQSYKDKARAEVEKAQRRAIEAEGRVGVLRSKLSDLDPQIASDVELVELRERERQRQEADSEEQLKRDAEGFAEVFQNNMNQFIVGMGIDPTDKRIDWGSKSDNYLEKHGKISVSVAKINKDSIRALEEKLDQKVKDAEMRLRKETGIDTGTDTSAMAGIASGSDAEFLGKFASGELPMTKENLARHKKIQQSY